MAGLEAVRVLDERGHRKNPSNELQRIDHKKRTSLPIQYEFPYRYVFPANHPYSSYPQFLGLPPAATPTYSGGGQANYDQYIPLQPPPFPNSLYQHQHLHQHQHQLQLQQPLPQQPPPLPPLPPQTAQAEFKYTLKPGSSTGHHSPLTASTNNGHMGPFQGASTPFQGGSAPTVLLLHATNPAAGSVQTFLLIPATTTDGGQSFGIGPSISPNFLNAIAGGALSGLGTAPGASQTSNTGAAGANPMGSPMVLRQPGHTKLANSHLLNQLNAAQLMARPVSGGVYQLPLMPTNGGKYYKRKKSSMEAKMSDADGHPASRMSTTTEASEIRNGHASRIAEIADQEETSSDTFEDYVPQNGPLSPKRS